jgi:uncharacterized protein YeaO (DUF488 family)
MITNLLSDKAGAAYNRYGLFTDGLKSIHRGALLRSDFGSASLTDQLRKHAMHQGSTFLDSELVQMRTDIQEIAEIARTVTLREIQSNDTSNLTDAIVEHTDASYDYFQTELVVQQTRDIATLQRAMQRAGLEVSIAARSRGKSHRSALMEYTFGNKADVEFFFHDRASRKYESRLFVRSLYRQTLLSVYNETVLFTLADHGMTHAVVEHHSPESEFHGLMIALSSSNELPTYSEIRDKVFHPNANAYLRMDTDVSA